MNIRWLFFIALTVTIGTHTKIKDDKTLSQKLPPEITKQLKLLDKAQTKCASFANKIGNTLATVCEDQLFHGACFISAIALICGVAEGFCPVTRVTIVTPWTLYLSKIYIKYHLSKYRNNQLIKPNTFFKG